MLSDKLSPEGRWRGRVQSTWYRSAAAVDTIVHRGRQRDCLDHLDTTRSPEAVLSCLHRGIEKLHAGEVAVSSSSNGIVSPDRSTAITEHADDAALQRARDQDIAVHPGQNIRYVVVDEKKASRNRVALAHEPMDTYDPSYYETQLVRAVESVLAPLGWDRTDIRRNSP